MNESLNDRMINLMEYLIKSDHIKNESEFWRILGIRKQNATKLKKNEVSFTIKHLQIAIATFESVNPKLANPYYLLGLKLSPSASPKKRNPQK